MIDPAATLATIVLDHSGAATVFDRVHLDYCCDGHLSLERACANHGVDLTAIIAELQEATALPDPEADARTCTTSSLISRVLSRQHRVLRAALALLAHQAAELARTRGAAHPSLRTVAVMTAELGDHMIEHLDREEDTLFPALLRGAVTKELRTQFGHMFDEHREFSDMLHRLRDLTHGYKAPDPRDADAVALLRGLAELEHLILRHHHVENHVLAPRFR